MNNKNFEWDNSFDRLYKFLQDVDSEFVIKLSYRVNIYDYTSKIINKGMTVYLVYDDIDVAACSFYCNKEFCYITSFAVRSEYHGRGLGSNLMLEVKKYAKGEGINKIILELLKDDNRALIFYTKNGFKKREERNTGLYLVYDME